MTFSLEICYGLFAAQSAENPFLIDFDLAWGWAGYTRKSDALQALKNLFGCVEGVDWITSAYNSTDHPQTQQTEFAEYSANGNQRVTGFRGKGDTDKIWLSLDTFEHFALSAQTQQGRQVRQHYIECRRRYAALAAEHKELLEYNRRMHAYYLTRSIETETALDSFYDQIDEIEAAQRRLNLKVYERTTRQVYSFSCEQPPAIAGTPR